MVLPQPQGDRRQESIVDRVTLSLHPIAKIPESHIERGEVVVDAPLMHHGGKRGGRGIREACQRAHGLGKLLHGLLWRCERVDQRGDCALDDVPCGIDQPLGVVVDHDLGKVPRRERDGLRSGRHWSEIETLRRYVNQRRTELQSTLSVRDCVVQLRDDGSLATGQPLEHGYPPQRTVPVEVSHALTSAFVENISPGRALCRSEPAHMEAQIKVRVDHKPWIGNRHGAFDYSLAQDELGATCAVIALH